MADELTKRTRREFMYTLGSLVGATALGGCRTLEDPDEAPVKYEDSHKKLEDKIAAIKRSNIKKSEKEWMIKVYQNPEEMSKNLIDGKTNEPLNLDNFCAKDLSDEDVVYVQKTLPWIKLDDLSKADKIVIKSYTLLKDLDPSR